MSSIVQMHRPNSCGVNVSMHRLLPLPLEVVTAFLQVLPVGFLLAFLLPNPQFGWKISRHSEWISACSLYNNNDDVFRLTSEPLADTSTASLVFFTRTRSCVFASSQSQSFLPSSGCLFPVPIAWMWSHTDSSCPHRRQGQRVDSDNDFLAKSALAIDSRWRHLLPVFPIQYLACAF